MRVRQWWWWERWPVTSCLFPGLWAAQFVSWRELYRSCEEKSAKKWCKVTRTWTRHVSMQVVQKGLAKVKVLTSFLYSTADW